MDHLLGQFGEVGQKRINVVHTACVYCPYASAPCAFYMIFLNMLEKAKTTCIGIDMQVGGLWRDKLCSRGNEAYSNSDLAKAEDYYTKGLNSVSQNDK
nr:hypothetical protein [Tanacetum cinerariifolium]